MSWMGGILVSRSLCPFQYPTTTPRGKEGVEWYSPGRNPGGVPNTAFIVFTTSFDVSTTGPFSGRGIFEPIFQISFKGQDATKRSECSNRDVV